MRLAVRSIVEAIAPFGPEEEAHRRDVLAWVDSGADLFRVAKPASPPKHLVSYCVLVDTIARQALLVDHRDAQLWLPTGGHVDVEEHPADAAQREIHEELGIQPEFHAALGATPLMVTVTETVGLSESHTDVSLWFAFSGRRSAELTPDAGEFVDTRWWDFDDIEHGPDTRFDPYLPRFVRKLDAAAALRR